MAYAAVVSLEQILKQLLDSDPFPIHYPKSQIQSLHGNIVSLQYFLEKSFPVSKTKSGVTDLETQIRDSAYEAEDTIEHYITYSCSRDDEGYLSGLDKKLDELIQAIDSIQERADLIKNMGNAIVKMQKSQLPSNPTSNTRNKPVGLEEDLERLKCELMGGSSKLEVVPIVGMPGIGKTTLATALYDDLDIERRFDIRAWVTVSLDYRVQDIFSGLLSSMNKLNVKTDDQLADNLYKILKNNRYLVVIDDMWDINVWDNVRRFLPDDKKGSRIILTTRLINIAKSANTSSLLHEMSFLNKEKSWKLLCEKVFADGVCPDELMEIGKEISSNCRGLALSIVVVSGLLYKASQSLDYWRIVADDINSISTIDAEYEWIEILSLSYNHLPINLKGCFLYLGAFPEDHEISISKLVKLWVAEGFMKLPALPRNLEEVGRECVKDLVDRNLVLVSKFSSNGQIKTCRVNGVIRDFCLFKATKENFFQKNIVFRIRDMNQFMGSDSKVRSLICIAEHHQYPLPVCLEYRQLRVLDALSIRFYNFPIAVLKLIHLRYLALTFNGQLPTSISVLRRLQILIVRRLLRIKSSESTPSYLPMEIWNMKELRHLQCMGSDLPNPCGAEELPNLLTLSDVSEVSFTLQNLERIFSLKKLGIRIELVPNDHAAEPSCPIQHLSPLSQLESFKCIVVNPNNGSQIVKLPDSTYFLPNGLKKITLSGCGFPWENMRMISWLPHLEVLKLRELAFKGPEWEMEEGFFCQLKFLLLESMDLVHWRFKMSHFPSLHSLILKHCYKLDRIPLELGEIETLKLIKVIDCSPSAMDSARQIEQEEREVGKSDLRVFVSSSAE